MQGKKTKALDILKISFFAILCLQLAATFVLASWPISAAAADATPIQFQPQIQIPGLSTELANYSQETGEMSSNLLARYIQAMYNYGLAIAGILAAIIMMAGGVIWLTSGGDSGKISQAKELITGSIAGIVILFSSWMILNTINPDLLKLNTIKTIAINKSTLKDSDDGIIDDKKNIPADAKIKLVCLPALSTCDQTDPPTLGLDINICLKDMNMPYQLCVDPYPQLWCCAYSETSAAKTNAYCEGKEVGTSCKASETATNGSGYCENNKCKSCKGFDVACSSGLTNYECADDAGFCGREYRSGDCNCNIIGGNCTCQY